MFNEENDLKIIDYDLVAKLTDKRDNPVIFKDRVGTLAYMAPEILTRRLGYSGREVDICALGVSLFVFLARKQPWKI